MRTMFRFRKKTTPNQRKLTLIGAGIGDPDLITLKAIKALEKAKVVLYDALSNPVLLKYTPKNCIHKFVGKRAGKHSLKQEEINHLIVKYASKYGEVVRLKGGDAFVFGRASEEINYVQEFGIKTEVIPGISSVIAAPALEQIPLTQRGVSESFWVITGTTKENRISNDIRLAAQSTATVIIIMGMRKLAQIMQVFARAGKAETPVAIIQNASLPNKKIAIGNVCTIHQIAEEQNLGSPAVIVIGEVVNAHKTIELENLVLANC